MNAIIKLSKLEIPCFEELKMGEMNQLRINIIKLKLYCFNFLILNFNCLYKSIDIHSTVCTIKNIVDMLPVDTKLQLS